MDSTAASPIDVLLTYFDRLLPLDTEEQAMVRQFFHPRRYRKRQYILQEGDTCSYFNFVVRGCLRMYKIDEKGGIHILQFATEEWWINDLGSFHSRQPSELTIDALEDTEVLQIHYPDLITLYLSAPKFHRIFRVLVENSYIRLQKRLLQNISSTAQERYRAFLAEYPHLAGRLPNTQVAAYLGITPEFLSKIRSERK